MNGRDTPKRKYYWMALAKTPTLTFKSSAGCVASIQYLSVAFAHHVHHQTSGADPIERKNQGGGVRYTNPSSTIAELNIFAEYMYAARCCHAKYNISPSSVATGSGRIL